MSCPQNMVKKSLLLATISAAKDIRQWKAIAERKGILTAAQTAQIHTKKEVVDPIIEACPFC